MPERISVSTAALYDEPVEQDVVTSYPWGQTVKVDSVFALDYTWYLEQGRMYVSNDAPWDLTQRQWSTTSIDKASFDDLIDVSSDHLWNGLEEKYVGFYIGDVTVTNAIDSITDFQYRVLALQVETWKDTPYGYAYNHVWLFDEKPIPPSGIPLYLPTLDFDFDGEELAGFTADFIKPIDYDKVVTRLSPIYHGVTNFPWSKTRFVDIIEDIKWGYHKNDFLIGGVVDTPYRADDDAVNPPVEPPPSEVISFVNAINIYKLPERTSIKFDNLSLAYDIDSVSWVVNFDVPDQATANLIKPAGLTVTELEVDINGELFICFIARTATTTSVDDAGVVQRRIRCSGWSVHRLLSYPYSPRRSHVETSSSTPAGILNDELTGTGFTGSWNSVSWTIPANTYTYIEKAPLAALSELAQEVGAVIIPDPANKIINIEPRYPISPWSWDLATPDVNLSERQFFSIDSEWVPQESPDSIYCYGEGGSGVAVRVLRSGQPGTKTLPTITSSYFTDTIPAQERGRIEIAANGFKEIVPFSTYVDPAEGILQPLQLIEVLESDQVTTWRGQIVGVAINLKRNGAAIVQTIKVERHHAI